MRNVGHTKDAHQQVQERVPMRWQKQWRIRRNIEGQPISPSVRKFRQFVGSVRADLAFGSVDRESAGLAIPSPHTHGEARIHSPFHF